MLAHVTLILLLSIPQIAIASVCNVTFVDKYEFSCNEQGWVQNPSVLQKYKSLTVEVCAGKCLADKGCKSFRYIAESNRCILYSKYLEYMSVDYSNFLPGTLNDRECFSTNCDVINACKATRNCNKNIYGYGEYDTTYNQYACAYGRTAKLFHRKYQTKFLSGSLAACEVVENCISNQSHSGSWDIHYHIPTSQWVCIAIDDEDEYYFPSADDQQISRRRYTVQNSTVGAGYGYYYADFEDNT